jgi:hypothetical protein
MIGIKKDGTVVEVEPFSAEMASLLKEGGAKFYREVGDIFLCPPDGIRDCDKGSPWECGYCTFGICIRDYYG